MAFDPLEAVYLHLSVDGGGINFRATGACEVSGGWRPNARPDEMERELLSLIHAVGDATLFAYDTRILRRLLAELESSPAGQLTSSLHDIMDGVLLTCPTLHDLSMHSAAGALGVGAQETLAEEADEPQRGALLCREMVQAVRRRLSELSAASLALVRELLFTDADLSWLGLPHLPIPQLEDGAFEMLVAARPAAPEKRSRHRVALEAPLEIAAAESFEEDGPIAAALDAYARRAGQVEMAVGVAETLEDGGKLMVEAGTGVGKTFAYLVPAILWARGNADQVVISTNTRNLQEQLIDKDLPMLRASLGVDFEAALLKGRANYVCIRAFLSQLRDSLGSLISEDRRAAAYLVSWFAESIACDLGQMPAEASHRFEGLGRLTREIRSDRATCIGPGCQHSARCPMRVARARARNADIIVSNHALTLADTQYDVLPKSSRIVFDEAHNLESVATDQLGHEVSSFSFREVRRALGGDGRERGVRDSLARYLQSAHPAKADLISAARTRLNSAADDLQPAGEALGAAVTELCMALDDDAQAGRARVRLNAAVYRTPHWQSVAEAIEQVSTLLDVIADALSATAEELSDESERGSAESDLSMEAAGARGAIEDLRAALGTVIDDEPGAGYVLWAETVRRQWGDLWRLCAAPIDVGPALQRAVYDRREAVIMTSATLTVEERFDFMRGRLGLHAADTPVRELSVPSPFHYPEQLLMCIPEDIPTRGEEGRSEALAMALAEIAEVAGGGALLLFTSRAQMDDVFRRLQTRLTDAGLSPLCQYSCGPRSWLLEQLRERDNTVLFGLKSFWEGIDVPGDALRCVVIVKLPFAVPTEPIVQARCELADSRRHEGGSDYYIPETILGFKQGIGRLIRSVTDQGVVFVLDNRIVTRSYGQRFFASIPQCRFHVAGFHDCLLEAERWLK